MTKIVVVLAILASVMTAYAQGSFTPQGGEVALTQADGSSLRLPVQRVAKPLPLTDDQDREVRAYMGKWCGSMSEQNRKCIREAFELFIGLGILHCPVDMGKHPREIFFGYQIFTEVLNEARVSWYVRVPAQKPFVICVPDLPSVAPSLVRPTDFATVSKRRFDVAGAPVCAMATAPCGLMPGMTRSNSAAYTWRYAPVAPPSMFFIRNVVDVVCGEGPTCGDLPPGGVPTPGPGDAWSPSW